jgi:hypothetical protein
LRNIYGGLTLVKDEQNLKVKKRVQYISFKEFWELKPEKRAKLKPIVWHNVVGAPWFTIIDDCENIVFLRDPIDRVISQYHHFINTGKTNQIYNANNIKQFTERAVEHQNRMVRYLSEDIQDEKDYLYDTNLVIARHNLKSFYIGLTERFNESVRYFAKKLKWAKIPDTTPRNVNAHRPLQHTLKPGELAYIKKHNELDIILYEYAKELFRRQIEPA